MIVFDSIGRTTFSGSPAHQHPIWEISIYIGGQGTAFAGEQKISFKKGTIVFWPPNISHGEELSRRRFSEFFIMTKGNDARYDASRAHVFQDTPNQTFTKIASALNEEYQIKQPDTAAVTQDLFGLLLTYLDRWMGRKAKHPLVDKLTQLLIGQMHDPELEVSAVMKTLPMSLGHLREHFEHETGKSPIQFVTDLRINEAKLLLRRGFSVKEAGDQVGYPDPYYFSRIFYKTTGLRPSAYRAK